MMSESTSDTHSRVLDAIPVRLSTDDVLRAMKVRKVPDSLARLVEGLVGACLEVASPKAVYRVCYVDEKGEGSVTLEGHTFNSSVLRQNLDGIERVFPFVATCGAELDTVQPGDRDIMAAYCLETIRMIVLQSARRHVEEYLKATYSLGQLSRMAPGSLQDWPLPEQGPLFRLLGDVEQLIGVRLTDRFLMLPVKSVSGIFFPTEVRFESCQLCPRANCTGRRAPYEPELAARYGVQA